MPRYVAFLRAINVGGHTVTMAELRKQFDAMGFADVETFIASGNVLFSASSRDSLALARRIERQLHAALGYEVHTFVRTDAEIAAVATHAPFTAARRQAAGALCVAFLAEPLGAAAKKALAALKTEIDDFEVDGREVYWLCKTRQSDSTFSNAVFEKRLGIRATFRGLNTVVKLAAKHLK